MKKTSSAIALLTSALILAGCAHVPKISTPSAAAGPAVNLQIQNGKIMSAKSKTLQTYQPINVVIAAGSCQTIAVSLTNNEATSLKACYKNNTVFLDPKRLSDSNATRFNYAPLWQQGFTYSNITTYGPAQLMNADIRLKLNS